MYNKTVKKISKIEDAGKSKKERKMKEKKLKKPKNKKLKLEKTFEKRKKSLLSSSIL